MKRSLSKYSLALSSLGVLLGTSLSLAMETTQVKQNPWSGAISASHFQATRSDQRSVTDFSLGASYQVSKKGSISASLPFSKLYSVPVGADEIQLGDIRLAYSHKLPWKWAGFSFKGKIGATASSSRKSMDNDLISRPSLKLSAKRNLSKRLSLSLSSSYQYYWKLYKQTLSGSLLPRSALGASIGLSYAFNDRLSASASLGGKKYWTEQSVNQTSNSIGQKGNYSFGLGLGYQVTKKFSTSLGYSQGDRFMRNGRYEIVLYDPAASTVSLGMSLAL